MFLIGPTGAHEITSVEDAFKVIAGLVGKKKPEEQDEDAYTEDIHPHQTVFTVEEFKFQVGKELLTDEHGHGHAVKDGKLALREIYPSAVKEIPEDATHIAWCGAH